MFDLSLLIDKMKAKSKEFDKRLEKMRQLGRVKFDEKEANKEPADGERHPELLD